MRSRTIRLASPAFAARSTRIPFAWRAATVRVTQSSSATVENRRLSDRWRPGCSSLLIDVVSCARVDIFALANRIQKVFAYANRSAHEERAHREEAAWRPRHGCLALPASGTRHAHAPARDRS